MTLNELIEYLTDCARQGDGNKPIFYLDHTGKHLLQDIVFYEGMTETYLELTKYKLG